MKRVSLAFLFSVIAASAQTFPAARPDSTELLRKRILHAYGAEYFGEIDAIKYTFNIQSGDRKAVREWTWEPHTNCVTFRGRGPNGLPIEHAYTHAKPDTADSSLDGFVDQRFVNDNYWLLFPFHLGWDSNVVFSNSGVVLAPEFGHAEYLAVHYNGGGYTPGDTYVVFPDVTGLLQWWVFYRGGDLSKGSMMTWEQPVRVGPITISTYHRNSDGTVKLWFSDIAVKVHGNDAWIHVP